MLFSLNLLCYSLSAPNRFLQSHVHDRPSPPRLLFRHILTCHGSSSVDLVLLLQPAGETPRISAVIVRCRTSVHVQLDLLHSNSQMALACESQSSPATHC
jgi:hypothetical protein